MRRCYSDGTGERTAGANGYELDGIDGARWITASTEGYSEGQTDLEYAKRSGGHATTFGFSSRLRS